MAHGLSCSVACGIFPDQGLNPCALHWQADSEPRATREAPPLGFVHVVNTPQGTWAVVNLPVSTILASCHLQKHSCADDMRIH